MENKANEELIQAIISNDYQKTQEALKKGGINTADRFGFVPMNYAMCYNRLSIISLLRENGAEIPQTGWSQKMLEAGMDMYQVNEYLEAIFPAEAENQYTMISLVPYTSYQASSKDLHSQEIQEIIKNISEANKLMYEAIKAETFDPKKFKKALDLGSTFSGRDDQDQPALIVAIKTNNEKIIEIFLPMGDIYAVDNNGWSPLMHATKLGNKHVVKYLLEKLPVEAVEWKNFDGKTAVDIAKENNQTEILDMLEQYFENHKENGARQ